VITITQDAKIMADLLRRGYSMLNLSCPECNNPIFSDKKGEKFCAICKRKVLIVENSSDTHNQIIADPTQSKQRTESKDKYTESDRFAILEKIINQNITHLTQKLQNETQIDLIEKYTTILLKSTRLLLKLKKLK